MIADFFIFLILTKNSTGTTRGFLAVPVSLSYLSLSVLPIALQTSMHSDVHLACKLTHTRHGVTMLYSTRHPLRLATLQGFQSESKH